MRERVIDEEATPRAPDATKLQDQSKENAVVVEEPAVRKKKERNPNETFIVVRPPPSVSNHPLNLQLQLVPPQAKERTVSGSSSASNYSTVSTRRSGDFSGGEELGTPLARTPSGRSNPNRSNPSLFYASSSTSLSSIASTTSSGTSSGRRMIVPLYNLSAHNVMTNTVLDAGTDAKVAKFHKRGMEVLALAVLECVEVWPSYGRGGAAQIAFLNAAAASSTNPPSNIMIGSNGADTAVATTPGLHDADVLLHTPTSSAISLSSNGSHQHQPTTKSKANQNSEPANPHTPTKNTFHSRGNVTPTPSNGAKKIFNRIFKKKDSQNASTVTDSRRGSLVVDARLTVSPPPDADAGGTHSNRNSLSGPAPSPTPSHFGNINHNGTTPTPSGTNTSLGVGITSSVSGASVQSILQPPILGIHPTLSAPLSPPAGRPTRYIWIVRKWLKGRDGGLLGGVLRGVNNISAAAGMLADRAGGGSGFAIANSNGNSQNNDGSSELSGVEVRFEWVRGQSKSQAQKRKVTGQSALGKRRSESAGSSHEETQPTQNIETESMARSRRSIASEGQAEKIKIKNKSQTRAKTSTPRASMESRRSAEKDVEKERESIVSASVSEEVQQGTKNPGMVPVFEDDDGEESDPEDSETPWTCTLIISSIPVNPAKLWELEHSGGDGLAQVPSRRSHISNQAVDVTTQTEAPLVSNTTTSSGKPSVRPDAPGTLLKLKVGALSPAPHHPKVVAQLKVPYPLPDIEIETARVRKRVITPSGVARPVSRGRENGGADERERPTSSKGKMLGGGLSGFGGLGGSKGRKEEEEMDGTVLTAEEIKDVLSCTAFWVVVREGFGGVGKVSRKGDGWRIRG